MKIYLLLITILLAISTQARPIYDKNGNYTGKHTCSASSCWTMNARTGVWTQTNSFAFISDGPCPTSYTNSAGTNEVLCGTVSEKAYHDATADNSGEETAAITFNDDNHSLQAVSGSSVVSCYDNVNSLSELQSAIDLNVSQIADDSNVLPLEQCLHLNTNTSETITRDGLSIVFETL